MARAANIYILRRKDTKEILGAWTVKYEGLDAIWAHMLDMHYVEFIRVPDGLGEKTRGSIGPENFHRYDIQKEMQKIRDSIRAREIEKAEYEYERQNEYEKNV